MVTIMLFCLIHFTHEVQFAHKDYCFCFVAPEGSTFGKCLNLDWRKVEVCALKEVGLMLFFFSLTLT